jgi:hypothetical protein
LFWQVQVIVKNICITLIEISGRVTVAVEGVFLNAICAIYEAVGSGGILHLVEKVADAIVPVISYSPELRPLVKVIFDNLKPVYYEI